jgi:magnesium transporter
VPLLCDTLAREVVDTDEMLAGRLVDLVVLLDPTPRVVRLRVRVGRGRFVDVPWDAVESFDSARVRLQLERSVPAHLADQELLLKRHVLDAQIVDFAGKRLTRVGDIELVFRNGALTVSGVAIGVEPLLRRLGLRSLAQRAQGRSIGWSDLHLASHRGQRVQAEAKEAGPHLLPEEHRAHLLASLPPKRHRRRFPIRWIRRRGPT